MTNEDFMAVLPYISVTIIFIIAMVIILAVINVIKYKNLDIVYYVKRTAVLEAEVTRLLNENKAYKSKLSVAESHAMSNDKIVDKIKVTDKTKEEK